MSNIVKRFFYNKQKRHPNLGCPSADSLTNKESVDKVKGSVKSKKRFTKKEFLTCTQSFFRMQQTNIILLHAPKTQR